MHLFDGGEDGSRSFRGSSFKYVLTDGGWGGIREYKERFSDFRRGFRNHQYFVDILY